MSEIDDEHRISITVCGDGGCGKSSITLRLVRSGFSHEYDPTIEDSYSVSRTINGQPYFLSLTDTAGQEEYRGLWSGANMGSDAFLFVYDITNPESLHMLDPYMTMADIESEHRQDTGQVPLVKIVAGNKCDLPRAVSAQQGLQWAHARGCGFMETSALEQVNIEETFLLIIDRVIKARLRHKKSQRRTPSRSNTPQYNTHATATARTQPLTPLNEKSGSEEFAHRPGGTTKRGGFWARFKCW